MINNNFWNNFVKLCNDNGKKPNPVAKELGISSGSVTGWKNGVLPRDTAVHKIADYFGITVDELLADDTPKQKSSPKEEPNAIMLNKNNVYLTPLYENVSAGFGAMAIDEVIDFVPLYITSPAEAAETICIKVTGDSMFPKIEDGDIIQVHKQDSVNSGSVAVVLVDGEDAFVKRVEYGIDWIELHSFNPVYKTMRFDGPEVLRIRVVGLVKKVIKTL